LEGFFPLVYYAPDYVSDLREVIRRGRGSELKRSRLLSKVDKFGRELKRVGGVIDSQGRFVESLCADGFGNYGDLMFQLCCARLVRGDYRDWTGWEERDDYSRSTYLKWPIRRWRLEPVNSIALLGEQGIGDEILFGSCIPEVQLRVSNVVYECDKRLQDVFRRSLGIGVRDRAKLSAERQEEAFIPVGDLPRLFRKDKTHFPGKAFLKPLPEYVEKWKHLRGRTGIAWRGRTGQFKPEEFGIKDPVCLQYDAWPYETGGMTVPDCDLKDGIEDLFGICANLEKVVTVGQSIVHIAGSIGTRVEVVMAPVGSSRVESQIPWRYPPGKMRWYERVFVHESLAAYRDTMRGT
jgi:hypothetical protein